ncbi:class I SAM-dependent methyltransferase [Halopiger goleimassiliensis]|uniref:class I SAM-dependent methyltransferase n=1 Tax=Halopiger goleimassiliensis TaxID=1293048 RepID=UPI0006776AD9|nr:class I SAM-dependent methyltransferase [Halopiger goleimassiliensis]
MTDAGRRPIESRESSDPLGRAMLAFRRGDPGTLLYRDGPETGDGRVREHYFQPPEAWSDGTIAVLERLADRETVLDVGCGSGQYALWLQNRGVDVTAIDASPGAVRTATERGVDDARVMDMFDLAFDRDRFDAVCCLGTQLGLGGSLAGERDLLAAFARVTAPGGLAIVDNYDPTRLGPEFLGYRPDPREGLARRCFHLEYRRDGDAAEIDETDGEDAWEIGPTLQFLLCSPDRLRDATVGTPWRVTEVHRAEGDAHYRAVLRARSDGD